MKNNLRILSTVFLCASIPGLIITDWYFKGVGVLVMFLLGTIGLVLNQTARMLYPSKNADSAENYRKNKILNIIALVLFVQSPVPLIIKHNQANLAVLIVMVCAGIVLNQIANAKFPFALNKESKESIL